MADFWSSTHPGVLTTAGAVLFSGDPSGNFIAYEAATGKTVWHARLGASLTNTPSTWMLNGKQYVVVAAGESLFGSTFSEPGQGVHVPLIVTRRPASARVG